MSTIAQQIKGLKEERGEAMNRLDSLASILKVEKRDFTAGEDRDYNKFKSEIESFNKRLQILEAEEAVAMSKVKFNGDISPEDETRTFEYLKRTPQDKTRPMSDFYLRNFNVDERMQKADVFKVMRSLATGDTNKNQYTSHALSEVRSVTGTGLLNGFLSSQLWDAALPKTRLAQAGMKALSLENGSHAFAKSTVYPAFQWTAEGAQTTELNATFANVTFAAKTLRGFLRVSGELLQDGVNTDQAMKTVMTNSAARAIDKAGLIGTGSGSEPTGILNMSNINETDLGSNGAQISSYDNLIDNAKLILDDSGPMPSAAIMSPRTWATYAKLKQATTNAPLNLPEVLRNVTFYETSAIPDTYSHGSASSTLSAIFFGGFESLYLGTRLETSVFVTPVISDRYSYDYMLAFRGDFQCQREEDLGRIVHILP